MDNVIEASFIRHMFDFIEHVTPHIRTFKQLVTMKPEWMNNVQAHYLNDSFRVSGPHCVLTAYKFTTQDQVMADQELSEYEYGYIPLCVAATIVVMYAAYKCYNYSNKGDR